MKPRSCVFLFYYTGRVKKLAVDGDLEPAWDMFTASWIQTSQGGGFDLSQRTVDPSIFQAAATEEGLHSRVITALSYNAGKVVYFSYGWTQDTSTVYEVQVATATQETMATVTAGLAAQGYILTAIGGTNSADSYLVVGTRVRGDTMPRLFAAVPQGLQIGPYFQQGYATVGIVWPAGEGLFTYLVER